MIEIFIDDERLTPMGTFLKGAIRMKPHRELGRSRFLQQGAPWVYSNELQMPPRDTFGPGDWVSLESAEGQTLGYGFFNAHSLISFRVFERAPFRNEEQTRALFFRRLDAALRLRHMAYPEQARNGTQCFRLCFGESDGVPGFILDLFRGGQGGGVAVMQCHAAGADGSDVDALAGAGPDRTLRCRTARQHRPRCSCDAACNDCPA